MTGESEPHDRGGSFASTEPPDICFWRCVGDFSVDDLRQMYEVQERFAEGKRYILVLVDLSKLEAVSPDSRKAMVQQAPPAWPVRGLAGLGASSHFRVLANAIATAGRRLHKLKDNPCRFFRTEAEARAWLDERRAIVLKEISEANHP